MFKSTTFLTELECSLGLKAPLECIVTIIGTVFIYFEKYCQMVALSRVSRISRVRIKVSVRIRARFSFTVTNVYIAMAPPKLHSSL